MADSEESQQAPAAATPSPEAAAPADKPAGPEALAPIIVIKKIQPGHAGAHGGAWKIALADMMTAMMAFFLLMWILGATNESQRKSVADYFKPTSHSEITMGKLAGSNGIMGGKSIVDTDGFPYTAKQTAPLQRLTPRSEGGPTENDPSPNSENARDTDQSTQSEKRKSIEEADNNNFDKVEKEIREVLEKNPSLQKLSEQVQFVREKEGLRIEIIDKADFAMFSLGTSQLQPRALALIEEVAHSLATVPNKLSVRGHTDSVPFTSSQTRNNWSLSAERAESTRALLERRGVGPTRFSHIEGVADTAPYNPNDPKDPRNRRINITVRYRD